MLAPADLTQCYIDGQWQHASSHSTFAVTNPFDDKLIAHVSDCNTADALKAISAAEQAFKLWRTTTAKSRSTLLMRWYELILHHADALARLMTLESGKPITEAKAEVQYAASFVIWFSEEAKRVRGDVIPAASHCQKIVTQKQPVGVCVAITPWNFPLAMITRKCAPALAAGCTMIVKPAEATPLCALALAKLAELAGIPNGVFNVLPASNGAEIGKTLTSHPSVKKLSFTGSTAVGKLLLRRSATTVKNVSMELGGNAPFIVFADANLDLAVKAAMVSKFRNAGQTCVCANRFLVHQSVKAEFTAKFREAIDALSLGDGLGDGLNENTQIGPLINQAAVNKVQRLIDSACKQGATLVTGGQPLAQGSLLFLPTLIDDVQPEMDIVKEEIFGPVASMMSFDSEDQAIAIANATPYGLAAYVMTESYRRIHRMIDELEFGMIGVNEGAISNEMAPFGGMKESGLGREGSHVGIDEYLETKYVCLGDLS